MADTRQSRWDQRETALAAPVRCGVLPKHDGARAWREELKGRWRRGSGPGCGAGPKGAQVRERERESERGEGARPGNCGGPREREESAGRESHGKWAERRPMRKDKGESGGEGVWAGNGLGRGVRGNFFPFSYAHKHIQIYTHIYISHI